MHDPHITFLIHVFMAFFAIMNPIANSGIFLSLTDGMNDKSRMSVALKSCLMTFIIVSIFILVGGEILDVFGITVDAFRIAGGIIIFFIGYHMLQGNSSPIHRMSAESEQQSAARQDVAFSPLAMPILGGPGAITVAMGFAADATPLQTAGIIFVFAAMCLLTAVSFIFSEKLSRYIGENGFNILTRATGLILAVIGVQMGFDGAKSLLG